MAYIKFKELTKSFYFSKSIETNSLPQYVLDYLDSEEVIVASYKTTRDKAIFTNKKVLLFDTTGIFGTKKIVHIIPYISFSTSAIAFSSNKVSILATLDSGYQLNWKFINMNAEEKTNIRVVFSMMMKYSIDKRC